MLVNIHQPSLLALDSPPTSSITPHASGLIHKQQNSATHMADGRSPASMLAVKADSSAVLCCCRRISHYLIEQGGDGQMTPLLRLGAGACAGIVGKPCSLLI